MLNVENLYWYRRENTGKNVVEEKMKKNNDTAAFSTSKNSKVIKVEAPFKLIESNFYSGKEEDCVGVHVTNMKVLREYGDGMNNTTLVNTVFILLRKDDSVVVPWNNELVALEEKEAEKVKGMVMEWVG